MATPTATITSATNPRFKIWRELLTGKGLRRHPGAIVAGAKQVAEVLAQHRELAEAVLFTDDQVLPALPASLELVRLAPKLFQELDVSGTNFPLLLVRQPEWAVWSAQSPASPGCTLFLAMQNPDNVGAVIRSAAAFGAGRVVLLREAAHAFLPKAMRSAGPSVFKLPMLWGPSIYELDAAPLPLLGLDAQGSSTVAAPYPDSFGLVAGLEGQGLPEHLRGGHCRRIDMQPGNESLNAAAAVAIALYAWRASLAVSV